MRSCWHVHGRYRYVGYPVFGVALMYLHSVVLIRYAAVLVLCTGAADFPKARLKS